MVYDGKIPCLYFWVEGIIAYLRPFMYIYLGKSQHSVDDIYFFSLFSGNGSILYLLTFFASFIN